MPRLGPWRNVLGWPVAGVPWHQLRRDGWGLPWGFSGKTICTVYRYIYMIYIYHINIYIYIYIYVIFYGVNGVNSFFF